MKLTIAILSFALFSTGAFAQETKKSFMDTWPELKAFHVVMSETFHPSEEGNLKPIKTRVKELNEKAKALVLSEYPAEVNHDLMKEQTIKLSDQVGVLVTMINEDRKDKEITDFLSKVHDTFHEIIGLCKHDEPEKKEVIEKKK